jgi:hypothetical protein
MPKGYPDSTHMASVESLVAYRVRGVEYQRFSGFGGDQLVSSIDKTVADAGEAVADISDEVSSAVGGFGLSGVPIILIDAHSRS